MECFGTCVSWFIQDDPQEFVLCPLDLVDVSFGRCSPYLVTIQKNWSNTCLVECNFDVLFFSLLFGAMSG